MPSPFPGMNPYLEGPLTWVNFHNSMITQIRDRIGPGLLPEYFVSIEEHVYIHEMPQVQRLVGRPDLTLTTTHAPRPNGGVMLMDAPAQAELEMIIDYVRVPYLEILDRVEEKVVTVIEILSPSNKSGSGDRQTYLDKRMNILRSKASLIEIDLLRGGERMPIRGLPTSDYSIVVSRPAARPKIDVWPIGLRDPLPIIPIPLNPGEAEAELDLMPCLHHVYDFGGLGVRAYTRPPEPPLSSSDAAWAAEILGTAGIAMP